MHFRYSFPYKSFNRRFLVHKLKEFKVLLKYLDNLEIRGIPDDFVVNDNKEVSVIEVKTTSKKKMWSVEVESAIFQCQLYIWILKDYLPALGYSLAKDHYLEIYSQKTGKLLNRIPVLEDLDIEMKIRFMWRTFQGLEKMKVPPKWICQICSKQVKKECNWYQERKEWTL